MPKMSAGILMYRFINGNPEFLLVHLGGPFFAKKDLGSWSIPKGEFKEGEDPLTAAKREFAEETGQQVEGTPFELDPVVQKGGKQVMAWAVEGDFNPQDLVSNTFEMEWPPRSGRRQHFPEVDQAEWFDPPMAKQKINPAQADLIDQVLNILDSRPGI